MKQYFRFYINFEQNDKIKFLFIIEFVYNNNKHAFIKYFLFEIIQECFLRMFFTHVF